MVATSIAVASTVVDTGYTGLHPETAVPSETAAQDETEAQLGTALVPV